MFAMPVAFGSPAYDETVRLRDKLLRKPHQLEFTPAELAIEYDSYHLACYNSLWGLLACMVLKPTDANVLKMRQVAVEDWCQGRGVGTFLVNYSEVFARHLGIEQFFLHAREKAIPFYERLGYKKVGERFTEVTIPHYRMEKWLV